MKENGICGSHLKKNKKNKRKNKKEADGDRRGCVRKKGERLLLLLFLFSLTSLFNI